MQSQSMKTKLLYLLGLVVLFLFSRQLARAWWGIADPAPPIILGILVCLIAIGLVSAAGLANARMWIIAGLVTLAALLVPAPTIVDLFLSRLSGQFISWATFVFLVVLSAALVIAAMLLYSALRILQRGRGNEVGGGDDLSRKRAARTALVCFALGAVLIALLLNNLYWFTVWDNTDDPLGYLWLTFPALAALIAGVVLAVALPGLAKLVGLVYPLVVMVLMVAVSARAQSVDFRLLTEEHAGQVNRALDSYYAREGRYPRDLAQLTPWYLLALPGSVIIFGQDWCYDGGDDYYRLGYVYREHWSDPRLTGRAYQTKGAVPALPGICAKQIAALEELRRAR